MRRAGRAAAVTTPPPGYPLKPCRRCRQPIPWRTNRLAGRESVRDYYRREFCFPACMYEYQREAARGVVYPPVEFVPPQIPDSRRNVQDSDVRLPPPGHGPGILFKTRDEVRSCPKCYGTGLVPCDVGVRCYNCGKIVYTEDGAWEREMRWHSAAS